MLARSAVPTTLSVVSTKGSPRRSSTPPPAAKVPRRIFGPWRSWRIAMGLPILVSTDRMRWIACRCSAWVPWEKFRRATSIPARAICSMMPSAIDAGPIVQTILARRSWAMGQAAPAPLTSEGALVEAVEVAIDRLAGLPEAPALGVAGTESVEGLAARVGPGASLEHQLAEPLPDQERSGDPDRVAPRRDPQPAHRRDPADEVVPVRGEGRQPGAPLQDRGPVERRKRARQARGELLQHAEVLLSVLDLEGERQIRHRERLRARL